VIPNFASAPGLALSGISDNNINMRSRSFWTVLMCLVVLTLMVGTTWGCEGCKNLSATTSGKSVQTVQAAFSWSVLFMLGVPMLLFGCLLRIIFKACQAADAKVKPEA